MRFFIFLLVSTPLLGFEVSHEVKKIDAHTQKIELSFNLKQGEYLYKEGLIATVNNPGITLTPLTPSDDPISFFDKMYNTQKEGYTGNIVFAATAEKDPQKDVLQALMHMHFTVSSTPKPQELTIPLAFNTGAQPAPQHIPSTSTSTKKRASVPQPEPCHVQDPSIIGTFIQKIISYVHSAVGKTKNAVTSLFTSTGSWILRFLAAFLLGLLLSLTPCIYPMIPITIGILQASGSTSAFRNFLLAAAYTIGISTTFSLLGLVAALGSCVFGELQGSPFIIFPLACLLTYFGLSMFDFVHLYIPPFLQPKANKVKGGSFGSAYIFGAISGSVASPCLSPGLVLILNYVTNIGTASITGFFEGFLLLFIFGVGSSLPLLIIGTFSGSLRLLPKAGQWMVEVKKIVGIMLISMAFYHLSYLERFLPWYILIWIIVLSFLALGIYYFASSDTTDKTAMRIYKNGMGVLLITIACIFALQGVKALYEYKYPLKKRDRWLHDYDTALAQAQKEHKPLFIDIGATYCAACKILDKQIFAQNKMQKVLERFILLRIESDIHTVPYNQVKTLYGKLIEGFPTYLIVDPDSQKVLKKWSIEIDELSLDALAAELAKIASKFAAP